MTGKELKGFIFEDYYQRMGFGKENTYYSMEHQKKDLQLDATKLTEKNPDLCNVHYQSLLRNKNSKPVRESKIITQTFLE